MDELLAADEPPLAGQLDAHLDDVAHLDGDALHTEYRRLAAEQAALRRLATLVARGVEPWEVFDAVTKEMCRCVGGEGAGLYRYETTGEITLVAGAYHPAATPVQWPVGTRTPIAGNTLASTVLRTRGPARMDSYENVSGVLATQVRAVGHPRCGGRPGHRRRTRVGPGDSRFGATRPHAGRHRASHQRVCRTCRECRGGRIPR